MKKPLFIALLLIGIVVSGCQDDFGRNISLDKEEITLNHKDAVETVQLTSGTTWEVSGTPDWLTLTPAVGDNSAKVSISAEENNTFEQRTASLVFSNGHSSKTLKVTQLSLEEAEPFIQLSEKEVQAVTIAETKFVDLTTNRPWKIQNIPDWITVDPTSGDKSTRLTINFNENRNLDGRSVELTITAENATNSLSINQHGLKDLVIGPYLPVFHLDKTEYPNDLTYINVENGKMFVNPAIKDKIFLGNLVSHNIGKGVDIPAFTGYTFKPITVSTSAPLKSRTFVPSLAEQNDYVQHIISEKPKQILSFNADKRGTEFYSYRQLYAMGMANLGIKLDEVVTGSSYAQKEMQNKYGLIFGYKLASFSLYMDIPDDGLVIHEELKDTDKSKGVSYINTVVYGKIGLLVVQSTTDSRELKEAINKFIVNRPLSASERKLIESAEICHVYFDNNNEVKTVKGSMNALEDYNNALKITDIQNIYPIEFSVGDFSHHGMNTITYSVDIP